MILVSLGFFAGLGGFFFTNSLSTVVTRIYLAAWGCVSLSQLSQSKWCLLTVKRA